MGRELKPQGRLVKAMTAVGIAVFLGLGHAPSTLAVADDTDIAGSIAAESAIIELEQVKPDAETQDEESHPADARNDEPAPEPGKPELPDPEAGEEEEPAAIESPEPPIAEEDLIEEDSPTAPSPVETDVSDSATEPEDDIAPMAEGLDGGSAPYIYWDVRDVDTGELVPGATFELQHRTQAWPVGWQWSSGSNFSDCSGTCSDNSLDRDTDDGEFLLEHYRTPRNSDYSLISGNNYRVRQRTAPPGYEWDASDVWKTIGSGNDNFGEWNDAAGVPSHSFGSFYVKKKQTAPLCDPGYVYGISATGQIREVNPDGSATNLGTSATGVSSFNGIGIGTSGEKVYAYERSSRGFEASVSRATIWEYDTSIGNWTSRGHTINSNTSSRTVAFVAGGVNLQTGTYYLGGFNNNGTRFHLWEYDPGSNTSAYKGYLNTSPGSQNQNGDLAFDANGNLFVVRGSGTTTTVFSVTAANLTAANGAQITASESASVTTMNNVNGVAFDASGKAFLGSGSQLRSYDMPGWSGSSTIVFSGLDSTDLATCSSPPTITIEKYVEDGRVNDSDQFELRLTQGDQTIGEATTTGTSVGLQDQRIGPLPTVRGVPLKFSEIGVGTTDLSKYASSYQCSVDGILDESASGNGTSGEIIIPAGGQSVLCRFHNAPLVADIAIQKDVADALGKNPQPREGWNVAAVTTATNGSAVQSPTNSSQQTGADGKARWDIRFGTYSDRAQVVVSEMQQDGYEFVSGQCVITRLNGSTTDIPLTGEGAQTLTDIEPGDNVDCSYVNKPIPGELLIRKDLDSTVPESAELQFDGAYTCTLNGSEAASGTWSVIGSGPADLTPDGGSPSPDEIPAGATCSVTEEVPEGGLPNSSFTWGVPDVTGPETIVAGTASTIIVTNKVERVYGDFAVTKKIEGTADEDLDYSGQWKCVLDDEIVVGSWGPIGANGIWSSEGSPDLIPVGAECSVTDENGRPEVPVRADPSYSWDGDPDLGGRVVAGETPATITVTNTTMRELGSVTWTKVDEGADLLSGSEWSLEGPDLFNDGQPLAIDDCVQDHCSGLDKDSEPGAFLLKDLPWGEYSLTETRAPAGYYAIADPFTFEIGKTAPALLDVTLDPIVNRPVDGPSLPLTGGLGREFFPLAGAGILFLGFGAAGYTQIRKNRREVA